MINGEISIKIQHALKEIAKSKGETIHIEIVDNSNFFFNEDLAYPHLDNIYNLKVYTSPYVFYKYFDYKTSIQKEIKSRITRSTDYIIETVEWILDLEKLEVKNIEVEVVKTKWKEINELQTKLIELLTNSVDSMDYQNIGNTSRTIMDKLAREVFDKEKHFSEDKSVELQNGKFKNQLSTYLANELAGKPNKELRKIGQSSIDFVSDSIDLMNKTTHKLGADKRFAELCVMSTVSVINLIKIISEINES